MLSEMEYAEDDQFGRLLNHLVIRTHETVASTAFVGVSFVDTDYETITTGHCSRIINCPNVTRLWPSVCPRRLSPLRDIVFYHEGARVSFIRRLSNAGHVFSAPSDVYWFQLHRRAWGPGLCRMTQNFVGGWFNDPRVA
jgi:hypothetical protein